MNAQPPRSRIALLEGNKTLHRLFAEALTEARFDAQGPPASADLADLLIVDVDSDVLDGEELRAAYRQARRPVLTIGLKSSREAHADGPWLTRPFSMSTLVEHCLELLGLKGPEEPTEDVSPSEIPPPIAMELREETPTVEISPDDVLALEGQLGLKPGGLAGLAPTVRSAVEDVIELDEEASMVMSIEQIRPTRPAGGSVASIIEEHVLSLESLEQEAASLTVPATIRAQNSHKTTLPDAPAVLLPTGARSTVMEVESSPPVLMPSSGSAARAMTNTGLTPETIAAVKETARMLANAWDRVGLAARAEDRADRIERVLFALFKDGLGGAGEEIRRVPMAVGLAGNLEALSLIDLFHTLRDRRLRGRVELCLDDDHGGYVLYVDGGYLQDIDVLGGDADEMLLEILFETEIIDEPTYQRLRRFQEEDDGLSAPLVMRLRSEQLVTEEELRRTRRLRAERLFANICGNRRGNFTYIEIAHGSGQAWPIHQLGLKIDEMLLKIARENQVDIGRSEATARTSLVMDEERVAGMDMEQLTPAEKSLLQFFKKGETLDTARRKFADDTAEPVDDVVRRLKGVELLKRQQAQTSKTVLQAPPDDPHKMQTVVNQSWKAEIEALLPREVPAEALEPVTEDAGPEEATHKRKDYTIGLPPTESLFEGNELDELLSEAIADDSDKPDDHG
jgi:hypothetical protein